MFKKKDAIRPFSVQPSRHIVKRLPSDMRSRSFLVKKVTSPLIRLLSLADAGIANLGSKVLTNFLKAALSTNVTGLHVAVII